MQKMELADRLTNPKPWRCMQTVQDLRKNAGPMRRAEKNVKGGTDNGKWDKHFKNTTQGHGKRTVEVDKRRTVSDHKQDLKKKGVNKFPNETLEWQLGAFHPRVLLDLGDETCPKVAVNSDTPFTALATQIGFWDGSEQTSWKFEEDKIQLNGMHRRKK